MSKLRSIRKEKGLRRDFVASKLNICPDHLNSMERGKARLTESHKEKLAKIYGMSIEEIEAAERR